MVDTSPYPFIGFCLSLFHSNEDSLTLTFTILNVQTPDNGLSRGIRDVHPLLHRNGPICHKYRIFGQPLNSPSETVSYLTSFLLWVFRLVCATGVEKSSNFRHACLWSPWVTFSSVSGVSLSGKFLSRRNTCTQIKILYAGPNFTVSYLGLRPSHHPLIFKFWDDPFFMCDV